MTILEILQDARTQLQANLENEPETTKQYFSDLEETVRTKQFLDANEEGLQKYIDIKCKQHERKWEAVTTLQRIAVDSPMEDVGEVLCQVITNRDWFHTRLFETEDRLLIYKDDETTGLYFYPFKECEAYFGYVSSLPNGSLYFQGIVVQHEYYYETIEAVKNDFYRANFLS